jgi:hypothetical protein
MGIGNIKHEAVNLARLSVDGKDILERIVSLSFPHLKRYLPSPSINDVLECLLLDADAINYEFEEWAESMGYNPDSRKDFEIYEACLANAKKLISLVGLDGLNSLIESAQL